MPLYHQDCGSTSQNIKIYFLNILISEWEEIYEIVNFFLIAGLNVPIRFARQHGQIKHCKYIHNYIYIYSQYRNNGVFFNGFGLNNGAFF